VFKKIEVVLLLRIILSSSHPNSIFQWWRDECSDTYCKWSWVMFHCKCDSSTINHCSWWCDPRCKDPFCSQSIDNGSALVKDKVSSCWISRVTTWIQWCERCTLKDCVTKTFSRSVWHIWFL